MPHALFRCSVNGGTPTRIACCELTANHTSLRPTTTVCFELTAKYTLPHPLRACNSELLHRCVAPSISPLAITRSPQKWGRHGHEENWSDQEGLLTLVSSSIAKYHAPCTLPFYFLGDELPTRVAGFERTVNYTSPHLYEQPASNYTLSSRCAAPFRCPAYDDQHPPSRMGKPRPRRKGDTTGATSKARGAMFTMRMRGIFPAELSHVPSSKVTLLLHELIDT